MSFDTDPSEGHIPRGREPKRSSWYARARSIWILASSGWEKRLAGRRMSGVASFALSTPVAKLARLATAPDGAVWFAEESSYSFTRLKDGTFTRHAVSTPGIAPFGVAVDATGTVWGTLPRANRLVRISARGEIAELDPPTRAAQLGDVAVGTDGVVWFLEVYLAPGFTEISTVPLSLQAAGLDLGKVLASLVDAATSR